MYAGKQSARKNKARKKNLHLNIGMPNVQMRANHCYFSVFILRFLLYARICTLSVPVPVLPVLHVHSMDFGAIFFKSNKTCFSFSPATTCSENLTICIWFVFFSRCVCVQLPLPFILSFLNWKIKTFLFRTHSIWTESLLTRDVCLLSLFLFEFRFKFSFVYVVFHLKVCGGSRYSFAHWASVISSEQNVYGHFDSQNFATAVSQVVVKQKRLI